MENIKKKNDEHIKKKKKRKRLFHKYNACFSSYYFALD